ncbi:YHS domain-containing (seleno)protein [Pseudanabaena sp. 'Roaring Creek']|uniref:YHS domain-containing (seleno)protein n=1 Tax=Pseudanabaena sp. 'Roaring Creek' TaxID=1681830 RepID=UPI0006D7C19B|nr:YHS domain-containing (seleno)protein [Pseudanabaena sp. 'Roaring Creek']
MTTYDNTAPESLNLNGAGIALEGYDPVSYFSGQPALGNPAIAFTYRGAIYYFTSAANKAHFEAEPEKYLPQYGGFCATAVSEGKTFSIDPVNYNVTDGKLYLFYKGEFGDAKPDWDADAENRRKNADANWAKGNLPPA